MPDARPKSDPVTKLCAEIMAGRHDDRLSDLANAIGARHANADGPRFCWRIRHEIAGEVDEWTEETVTLAELAVAEELAKTAYILLEPRTRAGHLHALLVARLTVVHGWKHQAAADHAAALTQKALKGLISEYTSTEQVDEVAAGKSEGPTE